MRANAQTDSSPEVEIVNNMFQAFGIGNIDAFKLSRLDSTVWNQHRSELIPYSGTYKGKEEVVKFSGNIVSNVDIFDFKVEQIMTNGKTVVVLGYEKKNKNERKKFGTKMGPSLYH